MIFSLFYLSTILDKFHPECDNIRDLKIPALGLAALMRRTSVFAVGENLGAGAALLPRASLITYGYQKEGHD